MRLVGQSIVSAAIFDLRAAISTYCLIPPLLILHFPHPQFSLLAYPDLTNLRGLSLLSLCPSQVRFNAFVHLHSKQGEEI